MSSLKWWSPKALVMYAPKEGSRSKKPGGTSAETMTLVPFGVAANLELQLLVGGTVEFWTVYIFFPTFERLFQPSDLAAGVGASVVGAVVEVRIEEHGDETFV